MRSKSLSSVAAGAAILSAGMLASRLLGFVRERLMFTSFGDSDVNGAYTLAFTVPDFFYYLLAGGVLSAAFIPVLSGYLATGREDDARRTGGSIATLLMLVMTVVIVAIIATADIVVGMLPGSREMAASTRDLTVSLMRIMSVMLLFTALSGFLTGYLQARKHFLTPAIVWSAYNVVIIAGIIVLARMPMVGGTADAPSIYGVSYSIVAAAAMMAVIQLPVAMRFGFRPQWRIEWAHEGVRKVLKLFAPLVVSLSLSQLNLMVIPIIVGNLCGPPAVTDIRAAQRLVLLPLGLFATAISTAAFPQLAEQVARGEMQEFRATIRRALVVILLLSFPSAMALFVLAQPSIYLLFGGNKFGHEGVRAASFVLIWFSWALIGLGAQQIINRAFYALHDTIRPMIVGVGMVAICAVASYLLLMYTPFKYAGPAVATTVSTVGATLVLLELLRRRLGGLEGRALLGTLGKTVLATLAMGAVMVVVASIHPPVIREIANGAPLNIPVVPTFPWPAPFVPLSKPLGDGIPLVFGRGTQLHILMQIALSTGLGLLAYGLVLRLLKVEELTIVTSRLLGRFRGKRAAEAG